MPRDKHGGKTGRAGQATAWSALAVTLVFGWALTAGRAGAQEPLPECPPGQPATIYCHIPNPPPETPFENRQPPAPTAQPSGPKLMTPFPKVRTAGSFNSKFTLFTRVTVKAPRGSAIDARCNKKRCKRTRRTAGRKVVRLRALQRSFRSGTTLTIRVTGPNVIGKYVSIRTRRGKPPIRRDSCLRPGAAAPSPCGASG